MKNLYLRYLGIAIFAICFTSSLRAAKPKIDTTFTLEDGIFVMEITGIKNPIILAKKVPTVISLDEAKDVYKNGVVTSIDTAFTLESEDLKTNFKALWNGYPEKITTQSYKLDSTQQLIIPIGTPLFSETPEGFYFEKAHMSCACSGAPHLIGGSLVKAGFIGLIVWIITNEIDSIKGWIGFIFSWVLTLMAGLILPRLKFYFKNYFRNGNGVLVMAGSAGLLYFAMHIFRIFKFEDASIIGTGILHSFVFVIGIGFSIFLVMRKKGQTGKQSFVGRNEVHV